jgi:hypothetical protein
VVALRSFCAQPDAWARLLALPVVRKREAVKGVVAVMCAKVCVLCVCVTSAGVI